MPIPWFEHSASLRSQHFDELSLLTQDFTVPDWGHADHLTFYAMVRHDSSLHWVTACLPSKGMNNHK